MLEDHDLLHRAFTYTISPLDVAQDPTKLAAPLRTFLLVYTAQGLEEACDGIRDGVNRA